jgi:hypothetical protein
MITVKSDWMVSTADGGSSKPETIARRCTHRNRKTGTALAGRASRVMGQSRSVSYHGYRTTEKRRIRFRGIVQSFGFIDHTAC